MRNDRLPLSAGVSGNARFRSPHNSLPSEGHIDSTYTQAPEAKFNHDSLKPVDVGA